VRTVQIINTYMKNFTYVKNTVRFAKWRDVKRNINVIAYKFTRIDTILLSTAQFYAFRDLIFMMIIIIYVENNIIINFLEDRFLRTQSTHNLDFFKDKKNYKLIVR